MDSNRARALVVALACLLLTASSTVVACSSTRSFGTEIDDGWITTKVESQFVESGKVDALDVKIKTSDGVVTLTGHVKDETERAAAVKIARETKGVKSVVDELEVDNP